MPGVTRRRLRATFPQGAGRVSGEVWVVRVSGRQGMTIQGSWLVRVLASSRRWHECEDCGARMFVKAASGCCPLCFTERQHRLLEIGDIVAEEAGSALQDWVPTP